MKRKSKAVHAEEPINYMYTGEVITCQICGKRVLNDIKNAFLWSSTVRVEDGAILYYCPDHFGEGLSKTLPPDTL